jgi:hypothetical protein
MTRIADLLGPSDVPYPGNNAGNNARGDFQPPAQQGFFNQFFAPTDLPYPLPPYVATGILSPPVTPTAGCPGAVPSVTPPPAQPTTAPTPTPTPAPSGAASQPGALSQPAAAQPVAPVTVIVQACPTPTSGNASSSDNGQSANSSAGSGSQSSKSTMPVGNCPTQPNEQIVTAFATNPRLRARSPRGQELLIEEMTGENIGLRMLSKDSTPVAFVVPDGCDAVDFTFGALELNPGHGRPGDLDEVITVGALRVDGHDPNQLLAAGDQLAVTVPWRHGSWIELAADRLRLPIIARFYQIETA